MPGSWHVVSTWEMAESLSIANIDTSIQLMRGLEISISRWVWGKRRVIRKLKIIMFIFENKGNTQREPSGSKRTS